MKTPHHLKVRVSVASEGYRETARTTVIELGTMQREEVLTTPTRSDGLEDPARFRRPTIIALASLLPMILLLLGSLSDRSALTTALEWAGVFCIGLVIWVMTFQGGERVAKRLAEAADHDAPDVEERTSVTVRPSQSMVLVGGQHRDESGTAREVKCVRVEESVVEGHKTLRAEYADGSSAVLLADLSAAELEEVCGSVREHDLDVV